MPASLEVCSYDFTDFMAFGLKCLIVCLRSASLWHNRQSAILEEFDNLVGCQ